MISILNNSSLNLTEDYYVSYEYRPETYIVPVLFFIIFLVGTLGNGTLIRIFVKHKNMRNVPNTYLFSLALGDLLVIWTSVPFTSTVYTLESWPYGALACKISESAKDISVGVSVFTLTALSADRYFAIVDPLRKFHSGGCIKREVRCTVLTIIFIWVLASILALPAAVYSFLKPLQINEHKKIEVCYPFPEEKHPWYAKTVVLFRFLVYYATPLLIIGFFYLLIARHLVLSTKNLPGESSRQVRARKKVAKMVYAFVFIFAMCFLPQHIFMLWFHNNPNVDNDYNAFWHCLRIVAFSLSYINSCINPIALFCVSATFRKYFNRYLFCCCRGRVPRADSLSSVSNKKIGTPKRNDDSVNLDKSRHQLKDRITLTTKIDNGGGHQ